MNNLTNLPAALLLGLLMLSHTATASAAPMQAMQHADAQTSPPNYVGASIGTANSDAFCAELNRCSDAEHTWKVYSGIRLTEKIQLEGAYIRFGEQQGSTGTDSDTTNTTSTSTTSGYTAAAVVAYPLNNEIELFGKGGMLWWDQELKTGTDSLNRSGNNYFFGAGANYNLGDNLGLRAEWERYDGVQAGTDNSLTESMDLISVGVTFSSL